MKIEKIKKISKKVDERRVRCYTLQCQAVVAELAYALD